MSTNDRTRMLAWLAISLCFYAAALLTPHIPLQNLLVKYGHVTMAAHVGYWIARHALGRLNRSSAPNDRVARALVIAAAMLAIAQGL